MFKGKILGRGVNRKKGGFVISCSISVMQLQVYMLILLPLLSAEGARDIKANSVKKGDEKERGKETKNPEETEDGNRGQIPKCFVCHYNWAFPSLTTDHFLIYMDPSVSFKWGINNFNLVT